MKTTPMMVATNDFTAVLDGVREQIVAGADYAVADHELVRLRPECWAHESASAMRPSGSAKAQASPHRGANAAGRTADAAEPWRLGPPPARHDVDLRPHHAATATVRLAHRAYWSIRDLARVSEDGRETGGLLLGVPAYSWQPLKILEATGPGDAGRAVGSLQVDHAHDIAVERQYRRDLDGQGGNIGHWHTHPHPGDDRPSDADLASWDGYARLLGRGRYVGLILTPDRTRGWQKPKLHGWLLTQGVWPRRTVCERLQLTR